MSVKVTVLVLGKPQVHMSDTTGNYATLCGLDGDDDDPSVDQREVPTKRDAKINCGQCIAIWDVCRKYRASDFDREGASHE